jgi:hypothetical protein
MDKFEGNPVAVEYGTKGYFLPAILVNTELKYLTMETIMSPEFTLTDNPELGYVCDRMEDAEDIAEAYVNRMLAKEARMDDAMEVLAQDTGHRVSVCFRSILEVTVEFDPLTGEVFSLVPYVDTDNDDFALLTSVNGEDTDYTSWCKSVESVACDIEVALSDRGIEVSEDEMDCVVKATWEAYGIASDIHDVSKAGWDTN